MDDSVYKNEKHTWLSWNGLFGTPSGGFLRLPVVGILTIIAGV